jgi:hypothetical protein
LAGIGSESGTRSPQSPSLTGETRSNAHPAKARQANASKKFAFTPETPPNVTGNQLGRSPPVQGADDCIIEERRAALIADVVMGKIDVQLNSHIITLC